MVAILLKTVSMPEYLMRFSVESNTHFVTPPHGYFFWIRIASSIAVQ
jgi:hypothetical protein